MKLYHPGDKDSMRELVKWVGDRIPHVNDLHLDPGAIAIGVTTESGAEAAGVVFNNFIPSDGTIQVHLAAVNPLWTRNNVVRAILGYPFIQLRVNKVWGATPIDLEHVLKVNRKMGFTREAVLRFHLGGKHAVITGMLKKEYLRIYWPDVQKEAA